MSSGGRRPQSRVDWRRVKERLEAARVSVDKAGSPSPEQAAELLEARAQALARRDAGRQGRDDDFEVVEFALGREKYAIASRFVREVLPLDGLTPLPGAPPFVLGLLNVRGEIVSLVDLRQLLGLPAAAATVSVGSALLLRDNGMQFAVGADSLGGVRVLPREALQAPPGGGRPHRYLQGVTARQVALLDAAALLHDPELVVRQQSAGEAVNPS